MEMDSLMKEHSYVNGLMTDLWQRINTTSKLH